MCSTPETASLEAGVEFPVAVGRPADLEEEPLDELERQICELAAHLAAATCRWLLLLAEWDERRGWAGVGSRSCAHWLSWRCSISPVTAREHLRVARRLRELPLIREAFARGELTYCKVRALTRVASNKTEPQLLMIAQHATGGQLDRLVRCYHGVLQASTESARAVHEGRGLSWEWEEDGSLRLKGVLPPEDGALLIAAIEAIVTRREAELTLLDQPRDSWRAARADALMTLARVGMEAPEVAGRGGDPVEMVVHVDVETLAGDEIVNRSEIEGGSTVSAETARRLSCDAAVVRVLERDGQPLSVGRRRRTISPQLRRALRSRDGERCCFPGCDHTRFLHAHHIQHWARGGRTELSNLVQLCSYHHRLVHEGGFVVEGDGRRGLCFRRADGRLIQAAPPVRRARGASVEHANAALGLRLDADLVRPRSAGQRLDYDLAVCNLMDAETGPAAAWVPPG
jgi:hypothetical protein